MMTMSLQLFFNHQCISMPEIIDWSLNENCVDEIIGKKFDKKSAGPFIDLPEHSVESTSMYVYLSEL